MKELENIVKSVVYGGIGVAATIVEKGGDIARTLVEKGQATVRANQGAVDQIKETAEDLKRRVRAFCERFMDDGVIDASCLTREQRDAVRQQLDEQDALDAEAAAACVYDVPDEGEPATADEADVPVIVVPEEEVADAPTEAEDVPVIVVPEEAVEAEPVPAPVPAMPTIELPPEEAAPEAPVTDDDVPVFEPEQPTYTVPEE